MENIFLGIGFLIAAIYSIYFGNKISCLDPDNYSPFSTGPALILAGIIEGIIFIWLI